MRLNLKLLDRKERFSLPISSTAKHSRVPSLSTIATFTPRNLAITAPASPRQSLIYNTQSITPK